MPCRLGPVLVALLLACDATAPETSPARVPRPERIILVSLDTVRADYVGGYGDAPTPTLRQLPAKRVVLRRGFKYIEGHEFWGDDTGLLYDLEESPGEVRNLREERVAETDEFVARLAAYEASLVPGKPLHQKTGELLPPEPIASPEPVDLSDEQRERLRQLGYL